MTTSRGALPAIDPDREIRVHLSQSVAPESVRLGTSCGAAASFRVERVDASGNCQGVVAGAVAASPREILFRPDEPWVKGQLYRYVLGSNGSLTSSAADCTGTQAICGSNGLPLQTQLLAQSLSDARNAQRGGPNMEIYFRGGDPLGGTSIGLRVLPVLDVNANFRLDAGERRSLLEHVRASGEHLYRYGRGVMLYSAVRQAFLARLRRRDPVAAALTGEPQVAAIAERTGLPADRIRTALHAPASHDRQAFRDRIALLIQLRNRL